MCVYNIIIITKSVIVKVSLAHSCWVQGLYWLAYVCVTISYVFFKIVNIYNNRLSMYLFKLQSHQLKKKVFGAKCFEIKF